MKYRVECVNRETGATSWEITEAGSPDHATAAAQSHGFIVGQVIAIEPATKVRAGSAWMRTTLYLFAACLGLGVLLALAYVGWRIGYGPEAAQTTSAQPLAIDKPTDNLQVATPAEKPPAPAPPPRVRAIISELPDPQGLLAWQAFARMNWALALVSKSPEPKYRSLSESGVLAVYAKLCREAPKSVLEAFAVENCKLVEEAIKSAAMSSDVFLPSEDGIVRFVRLEGEACIVITGAATTTTLNTLRVSTLKRGAWAMEKFGLPFAGRMASICQQSDCEYFGFVYFYGVRDFSNELELPEAEALCAVFATGDAIAFESGEMSQQELLRRARIFVSNLSTDYKFQRTEIVLE